MRKRLLRHIEQEQRRELLHSGTNIRFSVSLNEFTRKTCLMIEVCGTRRRTPLPPGNGVRGCGGRI
jgi:hypothetical protein